MCECECTVCLSVISDDFTFTFLRPPSILGFGALLMIRIEFRVGILELGQSLRCSTQLLKYNL